MLACRPSLVVGSLRLHGRSTKRRPSRRSRSSSCSPLTRRPSRRRVVLASSFTTLPQLHQTAKPGADAAARPARRAPDAASGRPAEPNSRQRRSAARSARRHAQLQVQVYRTVIAVLYICRLRRRCRMRADLAELESLESASMSDDAGGAPVSSSAFVEALGSKRAERPPSASSSVASSTSRSSSAALLGGFFQAQCPPMLMQTDAQRKQQRKAPPAPPYAGRM